MKNLILTFTIALIVFVGCADSEPNEFKIHAKLTVEEWKQLEPSVKYDPAILERLKEANAPLKNPRRWDKFMKDVVVPERLKDIPIDI